MFEAGQVRLDALWLEVLALEVRLPYMTELLQFMFEETRMVKMSC